MSQLSIPKFDLLAERFSEIRLLETTLATLEWDERTGLPIQGGEYRAQQLELLSGLIHNRRTDSSVGDLLDELNSELGSNADLTFDHQRSIAVLRRDYERNRKLPETLVKAITRATVLGQQAWAAARKSDCFADFEPSLTEVVRLHREKADLLKTGQCTRYDALMDDYEPGATTEELRPVFANLLSELSAIVRQCGESRHGPTGETLTADFPIPAQRELSRFVSEAVGFDFQRGRLDETDHPFCTTLGPNDHRILTRYQTNFFPSGLFGTLHEAGHGMYEQGLRTEWFGFPSGSAASLGIHESQSRLWENMVGRSAAFWNWCWPIAQARFAALKNIDQAKFVADLNRVVPSLIRVEADEVTYNLHIAIRFELERALIEDELQVSELPAAWNAAYQTHLGIEAPSDADGVLQDVHWSAGLFGYFPTYTLGNIFAAQFMQTAEDAMPDLHEQFANGEFSSLQGWLQTQVHSHGQNYRSSELVEKVTGQPVSSKPLIEYLSEKVLPLYR
jgi:carboxypeptidase Taq